jgi:hypothetical protein
MNERLDRSIAELRAELNARIDVLAAAIRENSGAIAELRADVTDLRVETGKLRADVTEIRGELREMRRDIERMTTVRSCGNSRPAWRRLRHASASNRRIMPTTGSQAYGQLSAISADRMSHSATTAT